VPTEPTDPAEPADPAATSDLVDALAQLSFAVQRVLSVAAAEHDLSVIQLRLLGILRDRQPGMLELAAHLDLDKSSVTGLVSRAEKRGVVRRSPSPHDGRGVLVSLTPAGRELTDRCAAEIGRRLTALTASLDDDERRQLTRLATALVAPGRPG